MRRMTEQDQRHEVPPSAMGVVRSRLVAKIDEMISQIAISDGTPSNSRLQIEANLVSPHVANAPSRRFVLDTIDVDELRHQITDSDSGVWHASQSSNFPNGLPSPMDSSYAGTRPHSRNQSLTGSNTTTHSATAVPHSSRPDGNIVATELGEHVQQAQGMPSLMILPASSNSATPCAEDVPAHLPKRRRLSIISAQKPEPPAVDKLIEGIWEQIHSPKSLVIGKDLRETMSSVFDRLSEDANRLTSTNLDFGEATKYCRQITTSVRTARAFEVIVQTHWVDCYDARLTALREEYPAMRLPECKRMVMNEACASFAWSDKELRNRM